MDEKFPVLTKVGIGGGLRDFTYTPVTWPEAARIAARNAAAMAGLLGILSLITKSTENIQAVRAAGPWPSADLDVDIPLLSSIEDILAQKEETEPEKEAGVEPEPAKQIPTLGYIPLFVLSLLGGGLGGWNLGSGIAQRAALNKLNKKIEEAQKLYNEALLKQVIAAQAKGKPDVFAPYRKAAAEGSEKAYEKFQRTWAGKLWEIVKRSYPAWVAATLPASWYIFHQERSKKSLEKARLREATRLLSRRLAEEYPFAQLSSDLEIDPATLKQLQAWVKTKGLTPASMGEIPK